MNIAERLTADAAMVLTTMILLVLWTMLIGFVGAMLVGIGCAAIIISWESRRGVG